MAGEVPIESRVRPVHAYVLVLPVLAAACGGEPGGGPGGDPTAALFRTDSAGVQIVEIPSPALENLPEWTLSDMPLVSIGQVEGEEPYVFGEIQGATRLETGEIVVLDRQAMELRVFGDDGTFLRSFGGEGDGPGEFGYPALVRSLEGSRFAAFDSRRRQATLWDAGSGLVSAVSATFDGCPVQEGQASVIACGLVDLFADGRIAVRYIPPGVQRIYSTPAEGVASNRPGLPSHLGVSDGRNVQIVDSIVGQPTTAILADRLIWQVPTVFRAWEQLLVGRDRLAVADNRTFEIRFWDTSGTLREIVRVPAGAEPVTRDRIEAIRDWAAAERPTVLETELPVSTHLDQGELGDSVPHFGESILDEAGRLWFADYGLWEEMRPEQVWRWTVIDRTGLPLARVTTGNPHHLLEIGEDYVLVRERDELQVERVVMRRLGGAGTP